MSSQDEVEKLLPEDMEKLTPLDSFTFCDGPFIYRIGQGVCVVSQEEEGEREQQQKEHPPSAKGAGKAKARKALRRKADEAQRETWYGVITDIRQDPVNNQVHVDIRWWMQNRDFKGIPMSTAQKAIKGAMGKSELVWSNWRSIHPAQDIEGPARFIMMPQDGIGLVTLPNVMYYRGSSCTVKFGKSPSMLEIETGGKICTKFCQKGQIWNVDKDVLRWCAMCLQWIHVPTCGTSATLLTMPDDQWPRLHRKGASAPVGADEVLMRCLDWPIERRTCKGSLRSYELLILQARDWFTQGTVPEHWQNALAKRLTMVSEAEAFAAVQRFIQDPPPTKLYLCQACASRNKVSIV